MQGGLGGAGDATPPPPSLLALTSREELIAFFMYSLQCAECGCSSTGNRKETDDYYLLQEKSVLVY